jgi:hypothetical protein
MTEASRRCTTTLTLPLKGGANTHAMSIPSPLEGEG